jgi:hypothetical protein
MLDFFASLPDRVFQVVFGLLAVTVVAAWVYVIVGAFHRSIPHGIAAIIVPGYFVYFMAAELERTRRAKVAMAVFAAALVLTPSLREVYERRSREIDERWEREHRAVEAVPPTHATAIDGSAD